MKAYILSGRLKPKYYSGVNKVNKGLFYEGQEMHPPPPHLLWPSYEYSFVLSEHKVFTMET